MVEFAPGSVNHHYGSWYTWQVDYINGLMQDCSNSSASAVELLQSCTKPSISWQNDIEAFLPLLGNPWSPPMN